MKSTKYLNYYLALKSLLHENVVVVDFNAYGWSTDTSSKNILIFFINPLMSDQDMFFTLSHEIGHHFSLLDNNKLMKRYSESEIAANNIATKIIKLITNSDLKSQYYKFYSKISKKNKLINQKKWNKNAE